ncbi:aminopeptidase N-like [Stegodyphus dumicola]|uniref:aminopeptidase N-like n=1 Tax=Stegodyphus dumicola TaxID=202533 RepID=UPI0015AE9FE8|nr:aminopeptidase N-like [Stegodyphus dumicola]
MSQIYDEMIDIAYQKNDKNERSLYFRIMRGIQFAVLALAILFLFAWCGGFIVEQLPQTNFSLFRFAERVAPKECCGIENDGAFENTVNGMLPEHVIPHHYNLTLRLFMPPDYNFTTDGKVEILIECIKRTKMIVLHARDLSVLSASIIPLEELKENSSYGTNISVDAEKQLVAIRLNQALKEKAFYILEIDFNGLINNLSVGLYRSSYIGDNGNVSWIASSQFQPSDARRVFPCFDEPGLKATFQLSIIRKEGLISLSNMPEAHVEPLPDGWEMVTFQKTPPMSTYLLAFVVGELKPFSDARKEGVQVWSRTDMADYGGLALSVTPDILKFFGDYLEVPYTMPKTDLVAVPSFLHAAMENWGLITFDESALLYDPERSSTERKVSIMLVIAHELAHQWFGNLVTPAWWDNLWLNEGFATYYMYQGIEHMEPDWNISHTFIGSVYEVMETDSLLSSRAMGAPVHPYEVLEFFDEISYLKGAAIVRMLEHFIKEENFRKGLKNYLWKYSYKSATENELWQNLNLWNRNLLGVKDVMSTWTSKSGYPVVSFNRNYTNGSAVVSQQIFNLDSEEIFEVFNDNTLWTIPITYTHGKEKDWSTQPDTWLTEKSMTVEDLPDLDTWVIANVQQVGYYRVNYDRRNWDLILLQLLDNYEEIHVINRAQIVTDILNLARADKVEYPLALNMTKYLYLEKEFLPWQAAFSAFRYIDLMLGKTEAHEQWKVYVLTLMTPLYKSLGWTKDDVDETLLDKFLRKNILKWSCSYGNEDCVERVQALFSEWIKEPPGNVTIHPDDREVVLCTGIARGKTQDWQVMWERYLKENFKGEKNVLLKALACSRETRLLRRLLKSAMNTSSGIPPEDSSEVFVYVAENFDGRDIVYDFFKNNAEEIAFRFGSYAFAGANIIDYVTAPLNSENEIEELESFLKRRKTSFANIRKILKLVLDRSKSNLEWMKKEYPEVSRWLRENSF